jgi:hypothetical protein
LIDTERQDFGERFASGPQGGSWAKGRSVLLNICSSRLRKCWSLAGGGPLSVGGWAGGCG